MITMSKCPYCNNKLHLDDFFHSTTKETNKGKIKKKIGDFAGEEIKNSYLVGLKCVSRMCVCPSIESLVPLED